MHSFSVSYGKIGDIVLKWYSHWLAQLCFYCLLSIMTGCCCFYITIAFDMVVLLVIMFLDCFGSNHRSWNKTEQNEWRSHWKRGWFNYFFFKEGLMNICKWLKNAQLTQFKCESNRFTAREKKNSVLSLFVKCLSFAYLPLRNGM